MKIIFFISIKVYNVSLFGNCLQGLNVNELLILQRSLNGLNEIKSPSITIFNTSKSEVEMELEMELMENCPSNMNGKCLKPRSLALVNAKSG